MPRVDGSTQLHEPPPNSPIGHQVDGQRRSSLREPGSLVLIESRADHLGERLRMRQVKYLNNIVEQDHRAIKWATQFTIGGEAMSFADRFYALAGKVRPI